MRADRDFWRLLADYERLIQNESAAIGAEDFDEVASIQSSKDALLPALRAFASEAGLDRTNDELARRVDAVLKESREHGERVGEMLKDAKSEHQNIAGIRQRLRELGTAYVADKPEHRAFSAHV